MKFSGSFQTAKLIRFSMIISKDNAQVKEIRQLKQAKVRRTRREYFVEGVRLVEEALRHSGEILKIVYSPKLEETERGVQLLSLGRQKMPRAEWLFVSDAIMGTISDTQSHQGILAVLEKREFRWKDLLQKKGILLLLYELQDPGNLGTIFRVADAGGATGIILSEGSIDPYNPKGVRASMGSLWQIPFLAEQRMEEAFEHLRSAGYRILAANIREAPSFWEINFSEPTAILFGQEGGGLPRSLIQAADGSLAIPMHARVESLNVAMAAGLVVYEALRQKTMPQF